MSPSGAAVSWPERFTVDMGFLWASDSGHAPQKVAKGTQHAVTPQKVPVVRTMHNATRIAHMIEEIAITTPIAIATCADCGALDSAAWFCDAALPAEMPIDAVCARVCDMPGDEGIDVVNRDEFCEADGNASPPCVGVGELVRVGVRICVRDIEIVTVGICELLGEAT